MKEFLQPCERRRLPARLMDIKNLNPTEKVFLEEKIKENSGRITVLVHPFFGSDSEDIEVSEMEKMWQHASVTTNYLKNLPTPVFVWEENFKIIQTKERLKRSVGSGIYCFVPTKIADPTPLLKFNNLRKENPWKTIMDKLSVLGVKSIAIGGRYLYLKSVCEYGCVGATKKHLSKDFAVNYIPEICFPDRPEITT